MERIRKTPPGYETKFAGFIRDCEKAKAENVGTIFVVFPWVIGDTYEEVMESLSRLAEAKLALNIGQPMPKA